MNKTVDLLQKLINHEKDARKAGSLAEAELFASRIQELLLKHKLDMTDVEFAEQEREEPIAEDFFRAADLTGEDMSANKKQSWVGILLMACGKANFCEVIGSARGNAYHLIGRASDKQTTRQLFKYLYDACVEVVENEVSAYRQSPRFAAEISMYDKTPASLSRQFISGFKLGFASAINKRLTSDREEARKKLQGANETGLIRLDQIVKAVEDFKHKAHPHLRSSTSSTRGHHGYERGKVYGSAVGISSSPRLTS